MDDGEEDDDCDDRGGGVSALLRAAVGSSALLSIVASGLRPPEWSNEFEVTLQSSFKEINERLVPDKYRVDSRAKAKPILRRLRPSKEKMHF
jgi:hypothetical protein